MAAKSTLFSLWRGGYEEVSVDGELVITDGRGILFQSGDSIGAFPARSLLKPFQFLAADIPRDRWDEVSKLGRYIPCLGSISATEEQVRAIETWYSVPELAPLVQENQVPSSYPMDERHRVQLKLQGRPAEQRYHTCFSKHAAILEGCQVHRWPRENYLSQSHPYQIALKRTLSKLLGKTLITDFVTDGCGLPSPVLSLSQMAELYRTLVVSEPETPEGRIRLMMQQFPEWIGGPGRVDTMLMAKNSGTLIAKDGADGLLGIGIGPTTRFPLGLGIVVKISAGYYPPLAALAVGPCLEQLGLQTVHQIPRGQAVRFPYAEKLEFQALTRSETA